MRILLIDDDDYSRRAINNFLTDAMVYQVDSLDNCMDGFKLYQNKRHEIIISDIRMPGMNGIELLKAVKAIDNENRTQVILITGFGELETSIEALRSGAFDYMLKPVNINELDIVIKKIEGYKRLEHENERLNKHFTEEINKTTASIQKKLEQMEMVYSDLFENRKIGIFSNQMQEIVELSKVFHQHRDVNVLIQGETGTGKEIIARLIHNGGQKSALPFISVNCSAISSSLFESELFGYEKGSFTGALQTGSIGKIELAQGGTIFFDEVGDLPFDMQPKLLRVLQEKELFRIGGKSAIKLDVRFIFATNANLEEMAQQGKFRTDLLYRVNTGKIFIPPLRERKTEIAPLALMLLKEITEQRNKSYKELDKDAVLKLESYHWPGNVRELRSAIERAVILSDGHTLQANQIFLNSQDQGLLTPVTKNFNLNMPESIFPLEDIEYEVAQYVLKRFDGNITQASRYLNISWRRLKRIAKLS